MSQLVQHNSWDAISFTATIIFCLTGVTQLFKQTGFKHHLLTVLSFQEKYYWKYLIPILRPTTAAIFSMLIAHHGNMLPMY